MASHPTRRRLAASTAAFGTATLISRLAGLARETIAAYFFGTGGAYSAFVIAFNVPNLIRSLVADNAISAAFVPVFVELRETRGEAEAWRVASIVIWMTAIVLGAVSAIFMLAAPLIMQLFVPGRGVSNSLVVSLTQIMFPIVVILGLTGVVTGILNSYNIFGLPAFAPVIWNLVIIGFLLVDQGDIYAYAWGILVATIVQFLVPLPLLRGKARRGLVFSLAWNNPHVKRILKLMIPVTIGLGLININLTIDLAVGSLASADVPSELNFAFRLFMLPQGLFSVAVSAVLFPEISRLAALGDFESFRSRITGGTRTIIFLLLPASLLSIALAVPITRLLFQRGQFTSDDTHQVALALTTFSLGLCFNGLALLLTRAFFALKEPRVPTQVAAINLVLNLILDLALYNSYGAAGIALSTSIVTAFNAIVLAVLLRRRVGSLELGSIVGEIGRIAIASVYLVVASYGVWWVLDRLLGQSLLAQIVSLGLGLGFGTACFITAGRILRLADVDILRTLVVRGGR
jgi:putative peptidoglycan lipid II flippase